MLFYSSAAAKESVKKAIRDELAKKGQNLQNKLDKAIGL